VRFVAGQVGECPLGKSQLAFAAHRRTPTSTSLNRAGEVPCETCAV
jgi:hypothetical protein